MAQDRVQWRTVVLEVLKHRVIFLTFSRAISRVNAALNANGSEISSVSIITHTDDGDRASLRNDGI
jgi:hypothetical protein